MLKESDIQKQILEYLTYRPGKYWRINAGAFAGEYKGKKRFVRFGATGMSDILGLRDGQFIAIEVKNEKGKMSEGQEAFKVNVMDNGGRYILARSLDDVIREGF